VTRHAGEGPATVFVLPAPDEPFRVVDHEADGALDVVWGSRRAKVEGDRVELAHDRFETPIAEVFRTRLGWVFVTDDGVCARSDTFTGTLEALGEFPRRASRAQAARLRRAMHLRPVVIDPQGRAWSSDGRAPFTRVETPDTERVRALDLAEDGHGFAALQGGTSAVTQDFGRTWSVLADTAPDVEPERPLSDAETEAWTQRILQRVRWALVRERPYALDVLPSVERVDGRIYTDDGRDLVVLDGSDGGREQLRRPLPLRGRCQPASWEGTRILFACSENAAEVPPVLVDEDGEPASVDWSMRRFVPSNQHGVSSVFNGCPVHLWPPNGPTAHLCIHTVEGGFVQWTLPSETTYTSPLFGNRAVVAQNDGTYGVIEVDPGQGGEARVETVLDAPSLTLRRAAITPAGAVAIVLNEPGTTRCHLAVGEVGEALSTRALPDATCTVNFFDARRGLAWGAPRRVFRTLDGGRTWERVPVPGREDEGAPRGVNQPALYAEGARCTAFRCLTEDGVLVAGWGPLAPHGETVLARRAPVPAPLTEPPWAEPSRFARYTCMTTGSAQRVPLPAGFSSGAESVTELRSTQGEARVALRRDAHDHLVVTAAWRGLDARGPFVSVSAPTRLPGRWAGAPGEVTVDRVDAQVVSLERARLALSIASTSGAGDGAARHLLRLEPNSAGAPLAMRVDIDPEGTLLDGVGDHLVWLSNALARATLKAVSWAGGATRTRVMENALLDDDPSEAPVHLALARRGSSQGVVVPHPTDARALVYFPVAPSPSLRPAVIAWPTRGRIVACTRAPSPDATTIVYTHDAQGRWVPDVLVDQGSGSSVRRVTVEVADGSVCLRRVEQLHDASIWRLDAQPGGALAGGRLEGDGVAPLRCEAQ
jgi:hypothetical protein